MALGRCLTACILTNRTICNFVDPAQVLNAAIERIGAERFFCHDVPGARHYLFKMVVVRLHAKGRH